MTSVARPTGMPGSLDYPAVPAGSIVEAAARRYGDRIAFAHRDEHLTYAELGDGAARFANGLVARGVGVGDRVAVALPNCLAYPVAYFGILLAGAVFVPVNPLLPAAAAGRQIADAGAVLTVTPDDVADIGAGQPTTPCGRAAEIDVDAHLAHLAYTGGTTGDSKGVRLTHRKVVTNTLQYACWTTGSVPALDDRDAVTLDQVGAAEEWPVRLGEPVVITLTPWFHAMGTIAGLTVLVMIGAHTTLHDRLDPAAYLADAERLRVTSMGGAPALFAALLACPDARTRDLTSVRLISSGAAPMPLEMSERLRELCPDSLIAEGYGLAEVTMGATMAPVHRSGLRKVGSVGVPLFDTEVRIVPAEGGGDPLPAGERGEVLLRGPQVMLGYHGRPEATDDVLVDGWLHTGDIGHLDEDGYLHIVDRKKDMLIYKGYNVYPRELEELLAAHPGVAACAVVGRPDPAVGELAVAFVVPTGPGVTAEEVMAGVNALLAPYKRLREVRVVAALPFSAAGKILKRELRARLVDAG